MDLKKELENSKIRKWTFTMKESGKREKRMAKGTYNT